MLMLELFHVELILNKAQIVEMLRGAAREQKRIHPLSREWRRNEIILYTTTVGCFRSEGTLYKRKRTLSFLRNIKTIYL